jgi:hypothetical protein
MTTDGDRTVAAIRDAEQALTQRIREAHETLKDLKAERRVAATERAAVQRLIDSIPDEVESAIGEQIRAGLVKYHESISVKIDAAQEAVNRRFDTLASIMLGEEKPTEETLAQHVYRWRKSLPKN